MERKGSWFFFKTLLVVFVVNYNFLSHISAIYPHYDLGTVPFKGLDLYIEQITFVQKSYLCIDDVFLLVNTVELTYILDEL